MNPLDKLETVTLFVDDLSAAATFYQRVFGRSPVYQDAACTVIQLDNVMINLLLASEAVELLSPLEPAPGGALPRMMLTIRVGDVDTVCTILHGLGVALLNGPVDRPWGRRTASFRDPAGHVWEIAHELPPAD